MSCRRGGRGFPPRGRGHFSWRGRARGWRSRGVGRGSRECSDNSGQHSQSQSSCVGSRAVNPQPGRRQLNNALHPCPYKKWFLYFPDDAYVPGSPLVEKVEAFKKYFETHTDLYPKDEVEHSGCVTINYADLIEDQNLRDSLPIFVSELREEPEKTLQCMGLACYQVLSCDVPEESQQTYPVLYDFPYINARVINFEPLVPLKNLKANYYGKYVSIRGTVVRVSNVRPLVTKMAFSCNTCGDTQAICIPDGKYQIPTKCYSSECRGRIFTPLRGSPLTQTIDWQTIRMQEIINDDKREAGRIPRTIECELTSDLVDCVVPGDMITISGIVKVTSTEENRNKSNKDKVMFLLYICANSIVNNKGGITSGEQDTAFGSEFNIKELYAIQEIQAEKNVLRLLVGSVCPSIYGHELVKAGLLLGLFGGSQKHVDDKNRIPVRGNPHILVVGDPGLGKSQMLQAVSGIAPRGIYVCGNTTSATGLTVTMSKDGPSGDYALEAGALVLGDQGVCCIDEFDKMSSQHQALLEAMEQQSISIAKAGIVCSLPARTSIIAAANPVGGHYNLAKTVSENLKMGSPLLSRFDLVFILLDQPDEEMDCMLSEYVLALHSGKKSAIEKVTVHRADESICNEEGEARKQWEADKPLSERLKVPHDESLDVIPPQLLRKYVAYARKYVHPKLTKGAAAAIQTFYLTLRQQHQGVDSTPITTRQLESLIRLTEARARLELREKATTCDAEDVIEIMKYSLIDTYTNEYGELDFQRSQHGSGMSAAAKAKHFVAHLSKIAERDYNSLFTTEQLRQIAKETRLQVKSFEDFIYSLNNQGFLLKKGAKVYQLQTSSCL